MPLPDDFRVGYVVKRYPRFSETFIVNEILAHEAAGLDVEIFALRPPSDRHFQNIISAVRAPLTYLPFDKPKVQAFWSLLAEAQRELPGLWENIRDALDEDPQEVYQAIHLARHVNELGVRHLHAHFATSPAGVARLAARFAGISYTLTAHAKDIFHESVNPAQLRRKCSDAGGVVTVSDFNVAYLTEHFCDPGAVQRIYNGMDLDRFAYRPPDRRERLIVAVGRLVEKKGFVHLIDACRLLADSGCEFTCQLVGSGELDADLRRRIDVRGLGRFIHMPGGLPQSEVARLIHRASVMVAPCVVSDNGDRDGLPTVLLESMALGTPCVSTDVTGIPEVLKDGFTGLMVPQRDPAALAAAIRRLLDDPALRVRLAGNARAQIEAEFDVTRNTARLREMFLDACHTPHEALSQVV